MRRCGGKLAAPTGDLRSPPPALPNAGVGTGPSAPARNVLEMPALRLGIELIAPSEPVSEGPSAPRKPLWLMRLYFRFGEVTTRGIVVPEICARGEAAYRPASARLADAFREKTYGPVVCAAGVDR